jgi:hypothetical protein
MAFKKGNKLSPLTGKKGIKPEGCNGRPKGCQNKETREIKELFRVFATENYQAAVEAFNAIDNPAAKVAAYTKIAATLVPRPRDEEDIANDKKRDEFLRELFGYKNKEK